jgi:hypothetical protein
MNITVSKAHLHKAIVRPSFQRMRVTKPGDPPKYLYSSESNTRFVLVYLSTSSSYAEYYQHAPNEVFGFDFEEELLVMNEENKWVIYYAGKKFWDEAFSIQRRK